MYALGGDLRRSETFEKVKNEVNVIYNGFLCEIDGKNLPTKLTKMLFERLFLTKKRRCQGKYDLL